ncbi:hypothetical protein [Cupriavidus pauculus]|uniref:Uncharacterized protein n=1 Tax=Cupriavidus pauculus TaxID=82633 RepID=A0A2N5CDI4_9BURK|nr:hypothetical protein [Cupriavidus pauculus]PLQ00237.1 hypothetical protein CYJ10_11275 [Cupriavidus pauculus]
MNGRRTLRLALPVSLALMMAGVTVAQTRVHYESKAELVGAAASGPYSSEKILQSIVDYCVTLGPAAGGPATAALLSWKERNATYLILSSYYRKEIQKYIAAPPDSPQKRALKKITTQDVEELIKANSDALILGFRKAQEADPKDGGANMCRGYFRGVDDGAADVKNRDPELAAFLDQDPVGQRRAKQPTKEQ